MEQYKTLYIQQKTPNSRVFYITLNSRSNHNALSGDLFAELPKALSSLDLNPNAAVIVICSAGPHFCSGLDLKFLNEIVGRGLTGKRGVANELLRREIKLLQDSVSSIERCRKPVIASINGGCIGAGIDLVAACDLRFCSKDSFFYFKQVDLGIPADLGMLQRLPGIVGYAKAAQLSLTGAKLSGQQAMDSGLVSEVFGSREELDQGVRLVAEGIAAKSPLAVIGTKAVLLRSKDSSPEQGLDYVATWNSANLISDDLLEAMKANVEKRKPVFSKL